MLPSSDRRSPWSAFLLIVGGVAGAVVGYVVGSRRPAAKAVIRRDSVEDDEDESEDDCTRHRKPMSSLAKMLTTPREPQNKAYAAFLLKEYCDAEDADLSGSSDEDDAFDHRARWNQVTRKATRRGDGAPKSPRPRADTDRPSQQMALAMNSQEGRDLVSKFLHRDFDTIAFAALPEVAGRPIAVLAAHIIDNTDVIHRMGDGMLREDMVHAVVNRRHTQGRRVTEKASDRVGSPATRLREQLLAFLTEIEGLYLKNPYHNAVHGCDVMQGMNCYFETGFFKSHMRDMLGNRLVSVIAGAIHDVGHTGQTNAYHVASASNLALIYNDHSPLENMHVSQAFTVMRDNVLTDWIGAFNRNYTNPQTGKTVSLQIRMRKFLIGLVLATDNAKHSSHVQKLRNWVESGHPKKDLEGGCSDWQLFTLETALHATDISNPTKKPGIAMKWTELVLEEFWQQGDLEKRVFGAPSLPMFDREAADVAECQIGFIKFIVLGLYEPLAVLVEEKLEDLDECKRNLAFWEERKRRGLANLPPRREWPADDIVAGGVHGATRRSLQDAMDGLSPRGPLTSARRSALSSDVGDRPSLRTFGAAIGPASSPRVGFRGSTGKAVSNGSAPVHVPQIKLVNVDGKDQ